MNFFVRILEALHRSRQLHAERVIRQHRHLVDEAYDYDRRRAIQSARIETAAASRGGLQFTPESSA